MSSKKLLIISPTPTHPVNAGNRARILNLVSEIKNFGFSIDYLYAQYEEEACEEMKSYWGDNLFFFLPEKKIFSPKSETIIEKVLRKLGSRKAKLNYHLDDWYDDDLDEFVKDLYDQRQYSFVMVEYIFLSKALKVFPEKVVKILDTHDVFSNRFKTLQSTKKKEVWFSTYPKEEKKGLMRAHYILAIQTEESRYFKSLVKNRRNVEVVGHIVPFKGVLKLDSSNKMLFIGSNNPVNKAAYKYLVREIVPLLNQATRIPQIVIAGSICNAVNIEMGIDYRGHVVALDELYQEVDIVINPTLYGTGLKIKSIEAIAHGKPVVLTPNAAQGLGDIQNKNALIAADARSFAESVIKLLHDQQLKRFFFENAKQYIDRYNSLQIENLKKVFVIN